MTKIHNRHTPLQVAKHFESEPSAELVWAPQYWSDWLQWSSNGSVSVVLNSDPQSIPELVREDYLRVFRGSEGWQSTLDRYDARTLVIDKTQQRRLFRNILTSGKDWKISYENEQAIVLRRAKPTAEVHICDHGS